MLDEARHWAEIQFGTADLGDARRTHRLVSIMAAIARAPDESLPRQLGSLANTKAGYRQGKRMKVCDPMTGALSGRSQVRKPCRTRQRAGSQSRLPADLRHK